MLTMPKQDALITSNAPATRGQMKQIGAMDEAALDGQGLTFAQLDFAQKQGKVYQRAYRKWFRNYVRAGPWNPDRQAGDRNEFRPGNPMERADGRRSLLRRSRPFVV